MIMDQLKGKVALITGAGGGIGRGIALRFASEGASVGVLDNNAGSCPAVVKQIVDFGGQAIAVPADVSDARAVSLSVERLCAALGPPTILVHTAGVMPTGTIVETSEEDWDRVYAVNVKGAFLACREVIPHMRRARSGSIILMASITGLNGLPGLAAYSGTKGALMAFARALAIDHAADGIRANSVAPGTIDSPMLHEFVAAQKDPERTRRAFDAIQPRGRVGTIDEVVNVVTFLASDQASLISGATIPIDGGMSVKGEQPRA
jgi:NAD(P)-dependent dehydrogenase (short-subunit alcohol dehydrogenase family)